MILERIQWLIHKVEVESGARRLNYVVLAMVLVAMAVWYDTHCYHAFDSPEAMDAAQVARNLARGKGFSTQCVRPFDLYLLQKHNHALAASQPTGTKAVDYAELSGPHPDLANAPLYPALLAALFKVTSPDWKLDLEDSFWSASGQFLRYKPEFMIALFNQLLFVVAIWLTFIVARKIFDVAAAWLVALLMFGCDLLWKFSVSGLPMLLLLDIFLGMVWCLVSFEEAGATKNADQRRRFRLVLLAGLLAGLGMLTRYSFGWVMAPVAVYLAVFGGARRFGLAVSSVLVFAVTVAPWIVRNWAVSGTLFGTAGYAAAESTMGFPGARLMQSLNPNMSEVYWVLPYLVKLMANLRTLLAGIPVLGGGWIGILFLAGLLLGLRNGVARRLRYFTLMCLAVFLVVSALGETSFSLVSDVNAENLLVLLTPLVIVFGVGFFLTLLNQMDVPSLAMRYAIVGVMVVVTCLPFLLTLLPPKAKLTSFPPYYPPDVQTFSEWMRPDELLMSDIPWAVAWYGDRRCCWTTINSDYEFFQLNDYVEHVSAIFLSREVLDGRLVTDCLQSGRDSWYNFVFERIGVDISDQDAADTWGKAFFRTKPNVSFSTVSSGRKKMFPLYFAPLGALSSGLFLADRQRW